MGRTLREVGQSREKWASLGRIETVLWEKWGGEGKVVHILNSHFS